MWCLAEKLPTRAMAIKLDDKKGVSTAGSFETFETFYTSISTTLSFLTVPLTEEDSRKNGIDNNPYLTGHSKTPPPGSKSRGVSVLAEKNDTFPPTALSGISRHSEEN